MKTLVFSVLYPGVTDEIVRDYVRSIEAQTDSGFDWLMINDHAPAAQMDLFPSAVTWIQIRTPTSFGHIRERGVAFGIEQGYDAVIFSDVDDYYSSNRVAATKAALSGADFVFTELQVVEWNGRLMHANLLQTLHAPARPSRLEDILDYNFIGLSHSGARTSALRCLEMPEGIEVVDWWIFSVLLLHGHRGAFIPSSDTFYRQSDQNYVGVFNPLTPERLLRGIAAKLNHYGALADHCRAHGMGDLAGQLAAKHEEMQSLERRVGDPDFLAAYIRVVNDNFRSIYRGWWSEILPLDRWQAYVK
jgi:hypothetical protein